MTSSSDAAAFSLWGRFRHHLPRFAFGLVLLAVYQYAQYWFDIHLQGAINGALDADRAAITIGIQLIVVALGAFVVRVMSRVIVFNAGRLAEYELRGSLLDRLHRLGPSFYQRMSSGEIMSRMTNDLMQVRLLLGFGVLNVINTTFALASALSVTLAISVKLTVAALGPLPLLLVVTRQFGREMFVRTRKNQDAIGRLSARVQASMAGVRVVRAFGLEPHELRLFDQINSDYLDKSLGLARLRGALGPIMQGIASIGVLVVFWYGGYLIAENELTPGGFLAFFRAVGRLTWPLMALGFLVSLVQRGRAAYTRLAEIYETLPDVVDGEGPLPARSEGRLEVRNLSFRYGERAVLSGVSFALAPGSSIAVVGRTGSGKSTLALLLARLLATPRGTVYVDGEDVCDLPLDYVRRQIGYAEQSPFLFSTTAGRNIAFALDDPDDPESLETARRAADRAGVLSELLELPDGLDTIVGERGVQLSGGQKQRVALARAFVAAPRILLLDDPLSAVDARTEQRILNGIQAERNRRSLILITHRVAAASRCDHVLVLDAGRVVEQGTHDELVTRSELYAAFAEEQRIESELQRLGAAPLDVLRGPA
ncbi:MAG TPA: ABC transporter ATP-binding protein [Polyangiaceae bacterium]